MSSEQLSKFRHARAHGKSIEQAARMAGISEERGHKLEGETYCSTCGGYVSTDECPHWDYES